MTSPGVSLRYVARHIADQPPAIPNLREALRRAPGPLRIKLRASRFAVMTHNMALLVAPGDYLGTDRDGVVAEIISRIRASGADVVGLCEAFDNDERATIKGALKDLYPHTQEGPDEDVDIIDVGPIPVPVPDVLSDGGLLLMSKHPILVPNSMIFRDCDGNDCLANKGVIHVRVHPQGLPTPIEVFYTHTQDITTGDGEETLLAQLNVMRGFIQTHAAPENPRIIMGDLNVPGEVPRLHGELLGRLAGSRDCWTLAGNIPASGFTFVIDNNFYEDSDDRPSSNERLDYVLVIAGTRSIPIVSDVEVLKFTRNGRFISDHFGLSAVFKNHVFFE